MLHSRAHWRKLQWHFSLVSSCAHSWMICTSCAIRHVKVVHDLLATTLHRVAGIRLHQGKTRVWNKAGIPPQNVEDLGPEVWQPSEITVLGTPIGSERYILEKLEECLAKERALWEGIPTVPDLQCAWQILLQSANPRANHTMRTMPPSCCAAYSSAHDEGIWNTERPNSWQPSQ